jgi:hypothetical protein
VIVLTVDVLASQSWETLFRLRRTDDRQCGTCHGRTMQDYVARKPNFDGIDLAGVNFNATHLTWDFVKRLRDTIRTKIMLKGILTEEDAALAVDSGVDGIIVSNHGGRVEDSGRATIDALPEIIQAVGGRPPVLEDSGFRRGTTSSGARHGRAGACIGRPYVGVLGAPGQQGLERAFEICARKRGRPCSRSALRSAISTKMVGAYKVSTGTARSASRCYCCSRGGRVPHAQAPALSGLF